MTSVVLRNTSNNAHEGYADAISRSCNSDNPENARNVNKDGNPRNNNNAYNRNYGFAADCKYNYGQLRVAYVERNPCLFARSVSLSGVYVLREYIYTGDIASLRAVVIISAGHGIV